MAGGPCNDYDVHDVMVSGVVVVVVVVTVPETRPAVLSCRQRATQPV